MDELCAPLEDILMFYWKENIYNNKLKYWNKDISKEKYRGFTKFFSGYVYGNPERMANALFMHEFMEEPFEKIIDLIDTNKFVLYVYKNISLYRKFLEMYGDKIKNERDEFLENLQLDYLEQENIWERSDR